MRNPLRLFLALVFSIVTGAHAQQLLTTDDGISLRGTVRLLQSNAATCNVVEANEPSYEEMRVNQDQPSHLWQLEFSVFNGSGRALDHLIAYYDIDSPWPPSTNWTENYRLGSEHDFIQVQWVGPSGRIQHTGAGMPTLPNQTHTETILLLAFNGVRPEFTDWSVNYTFMEGDAATVAPTVAPTTPQQAATDPSAPCVGDVERLKLTCTLSFEVNGTVYEAPYLNGVLHGTSIVRLPSGNVTETPYVNGLVHGTRIDRYIDGRVFETIWVNDEIVESGRCVAGCD